MATFVAEGQPGWIDSRIKVRDGHELDILAAIIRLSDGTLIGMAQDITERKKAELALRQHKAELEDRVKERTAELVGKNTELETEIAVRRNTEIQLQEKQITLEQLLDTHERYRQLVAYEIHDTFVQDVIGALMYLDLYRDNRANVEDLDLAELEKAQSLLREAVQSARRMISGLRPPIIDEQGVVAAIEYLVSELNADGMEIRLDHDWRVRRMSPVFEASIFRIVQEALTNVQRHSGTTLADVRLSQVGQRLELKIRDFGVGFDPEDVGSGHFGLRGIGERVRLLNGDLSIHSAGKGIGNYGEPSHSSRRPASGRTSRCGHERRKMSNLTGFFLGKAALFCIGCSGQIECAVVKWREWDEFAFLANRGESFSHD